jgi:hypothetical protein
MRALAGLRQTARFQPGVQFGVVGKVQPRREQVLARVAELVLDPGFRRGRLCPFCQPAAGVQATGSTG